MYQVSRFGIFISVAFYALLSAPMFMTFPVYLFSLQLLAYLYSLSGKIVFRWPHFYMSIYEFDS